MGSLRRRLSGVHMDAHSVHFAKGSDAFKGSAAYQAWNLEVIAFNTFITLCFFLQCLVPLLALNDRLHESLTLRCHDVHAVLRLHLKPHQPLAETFFFFFLFNFSFRLYQRTQLLLGPLLYTILPGSQRAAHVRLPWQMAR
ncbi:hypothetical protein BC567DRAFT_25683 [Phyllosticta citribraziliensis]